MRKTLRPGLGLFLGIGLLCASSAGGQEKKLFWRAMDVNAQLDADGRLHVTERQAMVFSGDWNGGERTFRIRPGQKLALESVARVNPATGEKRALSEGDLAQVDRYGWKDSTSLRWRSRLPSDPAFDNTEIVYEIAYTLSGILIKQGDEYLLDHDFAFPDRQGPIQAFSLDLALDSVWQPTTPWPGRLTREHIPPGQGVVVTLPLAYRGSGHPAGVKTGTSAGQRRAAVVILLAAIVALLAAYLRRETALGRFAPLPAREAVHAAWLEANVLSMLPEEAGALWDGTIGPPEVAAVIARLASEKKIEANAEGKKLRLKRLVPLADFSGYEKDLVEALFFEGEETDTDRIKKHYKSSGFDPASKIKKGLEEKLERHADWQDKSGRPSRLPTAFLVLSGTALLVYLAVTKTEDRGTIVPWLIFHWVIYGIALIFAYAFQGRLERLPVYLISWLWAPLLFLYWTYRDLAAGGQTGPALLVGFLLLRLGITNGLFNVAKTRDGPKKIARRKALAAAREFFRRELRSRQPNLDDRWFPYVIAFGLGKVADRWFRAYGGPEAATVASAGSRGSSGGSASTASGSSGSWTGGGGAFGGAGASTSWAAAAGAMAAGVAAPGSGGSGGGGGGGGGGSSGGGGGGGW